MQLTAQRVLGRCGSVPTQTWLPADVLQPEQIIEKRRRVEEARSSKHHAAAAPIACCRAPPRPWPTATHMPTMLRNVETRLRMSGGGADECRSQSWRCKTFERQRRVVRCLLGRNAQRCGSDASVCVCVCVCVRGCVRACVCVTVPGLAAEGSAYGSSALRLALVRRTCSSRHAAGVSPFS